VERREGRTLVLGVGAEGVKALNLLAKRLHG
jgi:hypothetical protein